MLRAGRVWFGCALAWLALSRSARADDAASTTGASYSLSWVRGAGADACASARVVTREVERRLGRPVFELGAERSLEVQVTRAGAGFRGEVFVRDASGQIIGQRTLESADADCSALVEATVLALALVIDPDAASRLPRPGVAAFESPLPAPSVPARPPSTAPARIEPSAPPLPPAACLPARSTPPERHVAVAISGRALLQAGVVPGLDPGFELAAGVRPRERLGYALSVALAPSKTVTRGIGSLDIGLSRVALLMTVDAARSERWRLLLAAGPSVGALHVAVREPVPVLSPGDYWWLTAQLGLDLQASISHGVFVEIGAAGFAALWRRELRVLGQSAAVWRQPWLSGAGFLGAGLAFP